MDLFVTVTVLPAQFFHLPAMVSTNELALAAEGNDTTA
ncbi:hypothetical protein MPS_1969 [Mycobacterium pseudoshottsii JCM 15466]|nr:hypothetical protein MPS_1969 [Mycobacterium pseudoshottsii JCM 15466]